MNALSLISCSPGREAPRTLRERLECSEGGNTGRRTRESYRARHMAHAQPSVQPPAGVERKRALYAARLERQESALRAANLACRLPGSVTLTSMAARYLSPVLAKAINSWGPILADERCVRFPRPRQQGRRHGQGIGRHLRLRAPSF